VCTREKEEGSDLRYLKIHWVLMVILDWFVYARASNDVTPMMNMIWMYLMWFMISIEKYAESMLICKKYLIQ